MADALPEEALEEMRQALYRGQKIEAIKLYRKYIPSDLREAKTAMDELEQELRLKVPEKFTAPTGGKGCAVTVGMLLAVAGIYLLFQA